MDQSIATIMFTVIAVFVLFFGVLLGALYLLLIWYRNRSRESDALDCTLLQVSLPRENEIKIDAAEQLFASLVSIGDGSFFKNPPHLSFEIVGLPGDIRFYVNTPNKLRDFIEKQINGAYPEAEILPITDSAAKQREEYVLGNEYNIFSQNGKVAFATLKLKKNFYYPIKNFKDFAVDPLSSMTSTSAKLS